MAGWVRKTLAVASLFLLFVPWMHFPYALSEDLGGSGGPDRYAIQEVGLVAAGALVLTLSAVAIDFGIRTAARPGATALDVGEGVGFAVMAVLLFLYQAMVWLGSWAAHETA